MIVFKINHSVQYHQMNRQYKSISMQCRKKDIFLLEADRGGQTGIRETQTVCFIDVRQKITVDPPAAIQRAERNAQVMRKTVYRG